MTTILFEIFLILFFFELTSPKGYLMISWNKLMYFGISKYQHSLNYILIEIKIRIFRLFSEGRLKFNTTKTVTGYFKRMIENCGYLELLFVKIQVLEGKIVLFESILESFKLKLHKCWCMLKTSKFHDFNFPRDHIHFTQEKLHSIWLVFCVN